MSNVCLKFLPVGTGKGGRQIAARAREGAPPGLFWLGGLKSDMKGTKAEALAQWGPENARAIVGSVSSGHGESAGDLLDGPIGVWPEAPGACSNPLAGGR